MAQLDDLDKMKLVRSGELPVEKAFPEAFKDYQRFVKGEIKSNTLIRKHGYKANMIRFADTDHKLKTGSYKFKI